MWSRLVDNSRALQSFYKVMPEPENLQIKTLKLVFDGPSLNIGLEFPVFPDYPSKKWPSYAKYLSAECSFVLEKIAVKKFGSQNLARIVCESLDDPNFISVSIIGVDIEVVFTSHIGRITSFSVT